MSFLNQVLSSIANEATASEPVTMREIIEDEVYEAVGADEGDLIQLEIVGESYHQDALAAVAGPKDEEGKHELVGVTLRCEPNNAYDANAIRVEVMGQLTGHVARGHAAVLSPAVQRSCAGALEAIGMIVGGWDDGCSEGHYGIRVWITFRDLHRVGVPESKLDDMWNRR